MYYNPEIGVEQYFSPDFIIYEDNEVFSDAGCYDLGSSIALRRYCPGIKKFMHLSQILNVMNNV